MRIFIPVLLIATAIGLFVMYINPAYQSVQGLRARVAAFDDALTKTNALRKQRDDLLSKRRTFSTDDLQKLEHMRPDNVDNIRLVIDINSVATRHGLTLKVVSLGTISDSKVARNSLSIGSSGDAVGSVSLSFTISATYDDFLAFLQDLEHSLRVVDVEKIGLKASPGGVYDISFSIRTYWLH